MTDSMEHVDDDLLLIDAIELAGWLCTRPL